MLPFGGLKNYFSKIIFLFLELYIYFYALLQFWMWEVCDSMKSCLSFLGCISEWCHLRGNTKTECTVFIPIVSSSWALPLGIVSRLIQRRGCWVADPGFCPAQSGFCFSLRYEMLLLCMIHSYLQIWLVKVNFPSWFF